MTKKIFLLFLAVCLMCFASAANATEKVVTNIKDDIGTYTSIDYVVEGDITEITVDSTATATAGENFKQIYQLPNLTCDVDFILSSIANTYADVLSEVPYEKGSQQLPLTYTWKVNGFTIGDKKVDSLKYTFGENTSGKTLTISGILPENETNYTLAVDIEAVVSNLDTSEWIIFNQEEDINPSTTILPEYLLGVVHPIVRKTISNNAVGISFKPDDGLTIDVEKSEYTGTTDLTKGNASFDKFVTPADGIELEKVSGDYRVTVNAPFEIRTIGTISYDYYEKYIAAIDEGEEGNTYLVPDVSLPSWLKVDSSSVTTIKTMEGDTYLTQFDIIAAPDSANIVKGSTGRIRVPLLDIESDDVSTYFVWDVTCEMASTSSSEEEPEPQPGDDNPFDISGTKEVNFVLSQAGATDTKTLTYTGDYSISKVEKTGHMTALVDQGYLTISHTNIDETSKQGTITLTATAPTNVTYEGTLIFYNSNNAKVELKVTVGVDPSGSASLTLNPSSSNLELESGGSSKTVTIAATTAGIVTGAGVITWSVKKNESGLNVERQSSTDSSITYAISAPANMKAGDYSIIFEAKADDGLTQISQETDFRINVKNSGGSTPQPAADFSLTADSSTVYPVINGDAQTANITVIGSPGGLTWKENSETISGLTVSITNTSSSGATVSFQADDSASEGSYTVTITATDSSGKAKTISFNVIVSETELTEEEKYQALIEAKAEKIKALFEDSDGWSVEALASDALISETASIAASNDEFAELDPAEVPVISLNGIDGSWISEANIYVFPVSYDLIKNAVTNKLLMIGEEFLVHVIEDGDTVSNDDYGIFVDNSGNQISTVPADGSAGINVATYLDAGVNYWPVISKYKLTEIKTAKTSLILETGKKAILKFSANKNVTSWVVSADEDIFLTNISNTRPGTTNISISALPDAEKGDYDVTVIAYDVDGTSADLTLDVTVTPSSRSYTLKLAATPVSISLTAGGVSKTVTVIASGDFSNSNLSWDIKNKGSLNVENTGTPSKTRHQYQISAPSTARAGTHTVVIEVSDGSTNTASININAVVSAASVTSRDQTPGGDGSTETEDEDEDQKRLNFIVNNSNIEKSSLKKVSESLISAANFIAQLAGVASNTTIAALDVNAFSGQSRTVTEISESFNNEEPILALPVLEKGTITEPKVYVFVVDIADKIREAINASVITPYSQVFIRVTKLSAESGDVAEADGIVSLSEENSEKGMFLDDDGNEITNALGLLNATNVNVAAYLEPDNDYSIVVTAADENDTTVGPSNAGCITGSAIGLIAMMLSSGIFKIRKKVKKSK